MKLAFVDLVESSYTPDTPRERPLGGTQSAAAYLAEALAGRGHDVKLLNRQQGPSVVRGVEMLPASAPVCEALRGCDAAIVVAGASPDTTRILRQAFGPETRLILWTGFADNEPGLRPLSDPAVQRLWDGFAFVSDWQQARFATAFGVPGEKSGVLRNAIAPAFETGWASAAELLETKSRPLLAYTSTPFRGLDVLLSCFPPLRKSCPGARLAIYSSMAIYAQDAESDEYRELYRRARAMDGVDYLGAVDQPRLAQALRRVPILAYPNTFEETSCIAVMEAMAAGCFVATVRRAALPETLEGFGGMIEPDPDPAILGNRFVRLLYDILRRFTEAPQAVAAELVEQSRYVSTRCTWAVRAAEWEGWLRRLCSR